MTRWGNAMHKTSNRLFALGVSLVMSACVLTPATPVPNVLPEMATTVDGCRAQLARPVAATEGGLSGRIELLNWNIKKGSLSAWQQDLERMANSADLVVLQEAALNIDIEAQLPHLSHESFARGFTTRSRTTGVATYSRAAALNECRFQVVEPLLRTPKATSVAEYPLAESEQTLLVVNVHAVNFTFGVGRYRQQLEQVQSIVWAHDGPTIVSGDFNTWSRKRLDVVESVVAKLELEEVALETDVRTAFNGLPLDHVYVRGFTSASGDSSRVESSDHNPLTVELVL